MPSLKVAFTDVFTLTSVVPCAGMACVTVGATISASVVKFQL